MAPLAAEKADEKYIFRCILNKKLKERECVFVMNSEELGKLIQNSLDSNQKSKKIETPNFSIKGNLLRWEDVVIQISNISLISSSKFQKTPFSKWNILFLLAGIVLLPIIAYLGLLCLAVGAFLIWTWYTEKERTKNFKYLNIQLNSGRVFSLLFEDKTFLVEVLNLFATIFEDDDAAKNRSIYIDIANCRVEDQSSVNLTVNDSSAEGGSTMIGTVNINK